MKTRLNKTALSLSVAVAFLLVGVASAQTEADITFPVAELENCASKEECRAYCDVPEHFGACRAFAQKYNLHDEREDKFAVILEDGGPGQCGAGAADPHAACRAYCDNAANMRECVAYAKTRGLMESRELEEAEKVLAALDRGVPLPGACRDKASCRTVCEAPADVEVARQCFAFAEAAGLLPPDANREKAELLFKAIEEGRAPFKTPQEFRQCENPQNDEILQKCVDFGVQNGFLSAENAEIVKKTGGKGPGGCRGEAECRAYCTANEDECFNFAEQHNILKPEDRARLEEGKLRFQEELGRAPKEVQDCLSGRLGADTIARIRSGEERPTNTLGSQVRGCFENHFQNPNAQRPADFDKPPYNENRNRNIPPEGARPPERFFQDKLRTEQERQFEQTRRQEYEQNFQKNGFVPPPGMNREDMERMVREKEQQYREQQSIPLPAQTDRQNSTNDYRGDTYEQYRDRMTPEDKSRYESIRQQYDSPSSGQQYNSSNSEYGGIYQNAPPPSSAPSAESAPTGGEAPQSRSSLLASVISVMLSLLGQ